MNIATIKNPPLARVTSRAFLTAISVFVFLFIIALINSPYTEASEPEVLFSFGLMTDIHYNDIPELPERPRYFRTSLENARQAVEIFNERGVDFIVSLGDSIDGVNRGQDQIDLYHLDEVLSQFEGDLHYVIGNHDLRNLTREEFLFITSGVGESSHYYFDIEGYRFIVLDANWRPVWTIDSSVVGWLEDTLIETQLLEAEEEGKRVIVFVHQGLDNRNHSHVIQNAEKVRAIFEEVGNVFAVFQGHTHRGGYWNVNGIHYSGIQAMVNYPFPVFSVVDVYDDGTLEVHGYHDGVPAWSHVLD